MTALEVPAGDVRPGDTVDFDGEWGAVVTVRARVGWVILTLDNGWVWDIPCFQPVTVRRPR